MGLHKTMESQRLLLRCFMLCTFVLWVGSCGDPHTGEVVSMDDTEQTKAVDKLTDLLHHEHKKSSISFSYSHSKATNLGEDSHKHAGAHKSGPADGLIQMGELLDGFKSLRSTSTGEAVSSLTSTLRAKELMDTLKPSGPGSFGAAKKAKQAPSLGENGDKDSSHPTFVLRFHTTTQSVKVIFRLCKASSCSTVVNCSANLHRSNQMLHGPTREWLELNNGRWTITTQTNSHRNGEAKRLKEPLLFEMFLRITSKTGTHHTSCKGQEHNRRLKAYSGCQPSWH